MSEQKNTICSFCVMDSTVPDIIFDKNGQCQYCKDQQDRIIFEKENYPNYLENMQQQIKKHSKKN